MKDWNVVWRRRKALNSELNAQVFELTKQLLVVQKENLDLRAQVLKLSYLF